MANDADIILKMMKELGASKARLQSLQATINDNGLSLDVDRIYDGFSNAAQWLGELYVSVSSKQETK